MMLTNTAVDREATRNDEHNTNVVGGVDNDAPVPTESISHSNDQPQGTPKRKSRGSSTCPTDGQPVNSKRRQTFSDTANAARASQEQHYEIGDVNFQRIPTRP
ncbi:unnamed protein product, partial [Sphacelaria rigidula]